MPAQQFGPIALEHIAKGALAKKLDERLAAAAQKLAEYVQVGGQDMTKKAKAEVVLKVTLQHVEAGFFTVKGDVTDKAPSTPLPATDRLVLGEENGQVALFMPLSDDLNEDDDPRQMTLEMQAQQPGRKKEL